MAVLLGGVVALGLMVWASGGVAGALFGGGWPRVSVAQMAGVLARLPAHLGDPARAWPPAARRSLPSPLGYYAAITFVLAAVGALAFTLRLMRAGRLGHGLRGILGDQRAGARWGDARDLRELVVRRAGGGRVVIGRLGSRLLAAEPRQSVLVVAPPQTGKTTGVAIPAVLEWDGPAVVCSVKTDLWRDTIARRRALGEVLVYDPFFFCDLRDGERAGWTPIAFSKSWQGAQRAAAWLMEAAPLGRTLHDADFWAAASELLLAPFLYAAASADGSIADVMTWLRRRDARAVTKAIEQAGDDRALDAAFASFNRDPKQLSSILTTVEAALKAYSDPAVLTSARRSDISGDWLLDRHARGPRTVYVCAPEHEQRRLRPVFVALIRQIVATVYEQSARTGGPIEPALLLCLDEAANIAPLQDLDVIAATGAGQGLQLVTVFQDLAQIRARWDDRAATIVSSHRARLFGPGIADTDTLQRISTLLGQRQVTEHSRHHDPTGSQSHTETTSWRALADPAAIRQTDPRAAILVYGHHPPARVALRPWHADPALRRLAQGADRPRRGQRVRRAVLGGPR